MKRFSILLLSCILGLSVHAANKISKPLKEAHKATCAIMAYDENGALIHSGQGFFIGEKGELLTAYELFRNATSAVCVDAAGISRPIEKVVGANELYNVIRLSVPTDKKWHALDVDSIVAGEGEPLYLLPTSTAKNNTGVWLHVQKVESSNGFNYYTLSGEPSVSDLAGRPLLNEEGSLVAVMQSSEAGDSIFYAMDARFGTSLRIQALTLNEPAYQQLVFPKAMPEDVGQAKVYLFVAASQKDKEEYRRTVESFIDQFPDAYDGYMSRASLSLQQEGAADIESAKRDHQKALEVAENKDEVYFEISKQIASSIQADSTLISEGWNTEQAIENAREAIALRPLSAYYRHLGELLFWDKKYAEAKDAYLAVCHSAEGDAESYYNAAVVSEQAGDSLAYIVALMDSAVLLSSPASAMKDGKHTYQSAPYIYQRAMLKARHGSLRSAVADLNLYEDAVGASATDQFYYVREQIETSTKMYQQALDDIDKAIELNPQPIYLLEKATLNIRINRVDEALSILEGLTASFPDDADCNRMLGYCLAVKGDKKRARTYLEKAILLGDENAENILKHYCE
ncbi:MAG: tetratricopeptide repeat protein [Bacteroidaceae bacterium]|nr:tetratricopeptide repeat protein [Bacteroidaceae bacterium]